jgi:Cellulase (glycosyl hydrolase family 5)
MSNTLNVSFGEGPATLYVAPITYQSQVGPLVGTQTGTQTFNLSIAPITYSTSVVPASLTVTSSGGVLYAIPPSRITLWQPGLSACPTSGAGAPTAPPTGWAGGIPSNYAQFGATITSTGADQTSQINTALASAGAIASRNSPQYVQLALGVFDVSGVGVQITSSYVKLVGSGPGPGMVGALATLPSASAATLIVKTDYATNGSPAVVIGQYQNLVTMAQTVAFASDAVQGQFSVTLAAAPPAGMAAGEIVFCNELYDPTLTWYNLNGGQGGSSQSYNGQGEGQYGVPAAQSRPIGQAMEIAAISGNTVTFTTPFHQTYRVSQSGHLGRVNLNSRTTWSGLENCFVTQGSGGDGGGNVVIGIASYCWVRSVESAGRGYGSAASGGGLVHLFSSFRCEVRECYVHSIASEIPNISPGGAYYNIVIDAYAADNLIENNITWIGNKDDVMRGTGGGNVWGYNYCDDPFGNTYPNQMEVGLNADHMTTSHHELMEGNYAHQLGTDSRWGNSIFITWFRNWATAQRVSAWPGIVSTSCAYGNPLTTYVYTIAGTGSFYYEDEYNRNPAKCGSHHWWHNYVGNVLGAASLPLLTAPRSHYNVPQIGYTYENDGPNIPPTINPQLVPMWTLGVADSSEAPFSGNGLDPSVLPVTLRDANFDYYTGQVHWHGIGGSGTSQTTPPGASQSGGATLPNSLYLKAKPAFFGTNTWPWVDGSSASNPLPGILPAMQRFQAGTPNVPLTGGGGGGGVQRPSYNTGNGLFVLNGTLYDTNGIAFVIKGLNIDDAYTNGGGGSLAQSLAGLAAANVNAIRFNVYQNFSLTIMEAQISGAITNQQVPIVTVQNVVGTSGNKLSGDTSVADLNAVVTQWINSFSALQPYFKHLVLNIANEWGPGGQPWATAYITAVRNLRNAGYTCPLMIDAPGYGQDSGTLLSYAAQVFNADPQKNIIFSLHAYGSAGSFISGSPNVFQQLDALALSSGMAFAIMEFGSNAGNGGSATPAQIVNAANTAGLGWAGWVWDDPVYALPGDVNQMTITQGLFTGTPATAATSAQLTAYGQGLVPYFANAVKTTDWP